MHRDPVMLTDMMVGWHDSGLRMDLVLLTLPESLLRCSLIYGKTETYPVDISSVYE